MCAYAHMCVCANIDNFFLMQMTKATTVFLIRDYKQCKTKVNATTNFRQRTELQKPL